MRETQKTSNKPSGSLVEKSSVGYPSAKQPKASIWFVLGAIVVVAVVVVLAIRFIHGHAA